MEDDLNDEPENEDKENEDKRTVGIKFKNSLDLLSNKKYRYLIEIICIRYFKFICVCVPKRISVLFINPQRMGVFYKQKGRGGPKRPPPSRLSWLVVMGRG